MTLLAAKACLLPSFASWSIRLFVLLQQQILMQRKAGNKDKYKDEKIFNMSKCILYSVVWNKDVTSCNYVILFIINPNEKNSQRKRVNIGMFLQWF